METARNTVDSAKRMMDLEAQLYRLTREKMKLTEEVVEVKDNEQNTKEMHAKVKAKYVNLKETFKSEESKWKEEKKDFEDKLFEAELDKKKLEVELKVAAMRIEDGAGSDDVAQRLKAEAGSLKSLLEEKDAQIRKLESRLVIENQARVSERISELVQRIVVLKKALGDQKRRADAADKHVSETLERISELVQRVQVLVKDNGEKDAQILKLGSRLEMEYEASRAREVDYQKAGDERISELVQKFEREKAKLEAEVRKAKNGKSNESDRIVVLKKALGDQKRRADAADKQVSEFLEKIRVLERAKKALEAEFLKFDKDKCNEAAALEAVKEAAESEKRDMNDEHTRKVLDLNRSIEVLRGEKGVIEAKLCQADRDKREEIKRISDEKSAAEDKHKNKVLELTRNMEVLDGEKRKVEAKLVQEKRDMREEIKKIRNEKRAIDKSEAKVSELARKIEVLETEKREMEAALKAKHDEKILALVSRVDDFQKEMEAKDFQTRMEHMEKIKSVEAEKAAFKEKNWELILRVDVSEKEKRRLEVEARKKDGVIKALEAEKEKMSKEDHQMDGC